MLTRSLRIAMHRREGQALVLAAILVLILSIAVLATINLGHNINERVRLQNTADAAAYSMAAMEARAFNFYAFSNRTQVSHYVAAMVWQSMLSFLYFLEAFFTDALGVILTANPCGNPQGKWSLICPALQAIPYIGQFLATLFRSLDAIRRIVEAAARAIQGTLKATDPDKFIGRIIIPGHRVLNQALSALSQVTLYGTMTHLISTSNDVIVDNDVNVDSTATRLLSGSLSACILERAHMKEAGVYGRANLLDLFDPLPVPNSDENDKIARAKRSMGKIANATRFACDHEGTNSSLCGPGWVTDRRPGQLIPLPGNFGVLRDILGKLDWKWGQTKMLSYNYGVNRVAGDDRNYIRDWKNDLPSRPIADLTQGDSIGSDDIYVIKIGPEEFGIPGFSVTNPLACKDDDNPLKCWGDNRKGKDGTHPFKSTVKTSIWAQSKDEDPSGVGGGIHWRLVTSSGINPGSRQSDLPNRRAGGLFGTPNAYRDVGLNIFEKTVITLAGVSILKTDVYVANVRPIRDQNHPWGGLVRFPHFEPGQYGAACGRGLGSGGDPSLTQAATRAQEFNQPSSWVVLNKTAEQTLNPKTDVTGAGSNKPALLNNSGAMSFAFTQPTKLTLDNTRKTFLGFKGLNVISRGQTYYHRPGNWAEQPNFFNPYWKPRLASVWQGRYSFPLVSDLENILPGPFKTLPQKIITH
jgi:hypothetical protein